jgi:hypothetical protein
MTDARKASLRPLVAYEPPLIDDVDDVRSLPGWDWHHSPVPTIRLGMVNIKSSRDLDLALLGDGLLD